MILFVLIYLSQYNLFLILKKETKLRILSIKSHIKLLTYSVCFCNSDINVLKVSIIQSMVIYIIF